MRTSVKMRRAVLVSACLTLCLPGVCSTAQTGEQTTERKTPRRPNVLFIAVDDLNTSLGCYGHLMVKSPHIDRLATRGVQFDRAYCQYPLCNPSRTSLLSGRRPDTTKIFDNITPPRTILNNTALLPEFFQQNGYFTARVGKIAHDTFENAVKWDTTGDTLEVNRRRFRLGKIGQGDEVTTGIGLHWKASNENDAAQPDGVTARFVVQLLERNREKPFFIAAGFHKPHLPFIAPAKYFDMYPSEKIPLPLEPAGVRRNVPALALTHHAREELMTDSEKRQAIAAYYACTSFMDAQVGLVLDTMDRLRLWDNTIVVLWGDHGFHLGEHGGLWRKMTLFEECARVPLIVAAPGQRTNTASPRLVEFVDIYPTLVELCGLPVPPGLEGTSFVPLLQYPDREWKEAAFTQVMREHGIMGRSIRTERWRYTEWGDESAIELYDHESDPRELVNLANNSDHAAIQAGLQRMLTKGWKSTLPPSASGHGSK